MRVSIYFVNQGHYKPWALGGVSRVNVFDLMGLGLGYFIYMQEHSSILRKGINCHMGSESWRENSRYG